MKNILIKTIPLVVVLTLLLGSCSGERHSRIAVTVGEEYDGMPVALVTYLDSLCVAEDTVRQGMVTFDVVFPAEKARHPEVAQVVVDGKTRGFLILEEGDIRVSEPNPIGVGTPMNDKFSVLYAQLDSVDNLDDLRLYIEYARDLYKEYAGTPVGEYLAVEYMKFADLKDIQETLKEEEALMGSIRGRKCLASAKLREKTSPGHPYVDFEVEQPDGKMLKLSDLVTPGVYTLVDFWASWCPYCVREIPTLKQIEALPGVNVVGVAVRDEAADTKGAIERFGITWPVMYNAARIPYDLYGFSGIPHHILIGPDGKIASRGESAEQLLERLSKKK